MFFNVYVTYSTPEHDVQTNDPTVMFTYVTPFCPQSKHWRFVPEATISRKVFKILSLSCFGLSIFFAILLLLLLSLSSIFFRLFREIRK
jgi:hypothetical protein